MGGGYIARQSEFTEHRIQNTAGAKLMSIKLPTYHTCCFIWRFDIMILTGANPLLGPLEGVSPENLFWDQMALALLVVLSGPKEVSFSGPTPPMALEMDLSPSKPLCPTPYKQ
jgi:hypothetical protein